MKYNGTETNIPQNFRTIRQQVIWGNRHILLKGKELFFKNWIEIDENGKISEKSIIEKLKSKHNWISEIAQIKKAVPKDWVQLMQKEDSINTKVKMNKMIKIQQKKYNRNDSKRHLQVINYTRQ